MMKKLMIVFGSLLGLLILTAIIVPLVFDVDKYRPVIVSKANEKINGKLELGKLGLSLWGKVKIDVDGLKLADARGVQVIDVKDASFNLPLLSLISGRPEVRVSLNEPAINVVKQRDGKLNVMSLMRETADEGSGSGASGASSGAGKTGAQGDAEVPAIVMNSRLTLLIDRAKLAYKDELTGAKYDLSDFNFHLKDVSPVSDMPFHISAQLDVAQQDLKVTGPVVLEGNVKATSTAGTFDKADAKASLKLDGLEITKPGVFHKKKGVTLGAEAQATVAKDSFTAPQLKFRLASVEIDGEASGKTVGQTTTINLKAHSNKVDLNKLGDLSPLVGEYNLNGLIELAVNASGPTDKLAYGADVKFDKVTLNNEALKQPLEASGALSVGTNELRDFSMKLGAKDFDLAVNGSMQNLLAPRFKFKVVSQKMDLDGLLKSSEKAAQARRDQAKIEASGASPADKAKPAQGQVVDYNAMFEPLRKNAVAAAAAGTVDFSLKHVKSTGVVLSDVQGQMALNDLVLALKDFSMRIFDGTIKGSMSIDAKAARPGVGANISMSGLQTQRMVESAMPLARNSIKGAISASTNIGGPGLNQSDIIAGWKGNGSMDIKDAVFSTLDVGREIKTGVIDKIATKLPMLQGKINVPDRALDRTGEYENVNMKFALGNGVFNINELTGKAHAGKGLDLKGGGRVQLATYGLDLGLDVIDTYNLFRIEQHVKDKRYNHFAVSPRVGGTLFSPKFDFGSTVEALARNAAETQVKEQLGKRLKDKLGDKLPGGLGRIFGGGGGDNNDQGEQKREAPKPADAVKALKGIFGR